jgi:hypothetical protein
MKRGLTIIGTWCAILFVISALLTLDSLQNWAATLPFVLVSGLAASLSFGGIRFGSCRSFLFWPALVCSGFLFIPYMFAMTHWTGGESSAGWTWQCVLGFGSLLSLALPAGVGVAVVVLQHGRRA